jgi:ABC-type multidrug transport system permease subunit
VLWNAIRKDLARHRRQPLEFLIWLGIPLMIGFLFTVLFSGGSGDSPGPVTKVLVVDEDASFVSGLLLRALSEENSRGFIDAEQVEREEGRARIDDGEATALLIIPEGFSEAVLQEKPLALPLITNPAQRILPRIVEEGLRIVVDGHFYLHRLIGEDLRRFAAMDSMPTNTEIAAFSVKMGHLFERLGGSFDPLLLQVVNEPVPAEEVEAVESPSIGFLMMPSVLFMAILFMASGLSGEIWEEDRLTTLRRILVTPGGAPPFLLGKLLTAMILFLAVGGGSLLLGLSTLDLAAARLPAALLWIAPSGAALTAMFTFLQLLFRSQRAANIVVMTLIFPLMMLGGSFFPTEIMPGWMAKLSLRTPNGWAMAHLKSILLGNETSGELIAGLLILLLAIFLFTVLGAWRLRARFARS